MAGSGSVEWVMIVNLIIWTGLFLYLLRLDRRLRETARALGAPPETTETKP
jgi:CcmD family protein